VSLCAPSLALLLLLLLLLHIQMLLVLVHHVLLLLLLLLLSTWHTPAALARKQTGVPPRTQDCTQHT